VREVLEAAGEESLEAEIAVDGEHCCRMGAFNTARRACHRNQKKKYSIIINTFIHNIRKCVNYTSSRLPHVEMGTRGDGEGGGETMEGGVAERTRAREM
jgi:hypothetical protein